MICNTRNKEILAGYPRWAEDFSDRLFGLIGYSRFEVRLDGMIFPGCSSIHCCFMSMTIDVIFLDRENRVVRLCPRVSPWRLRFGGEGAYTTVELPVGTIQATDTRIGDVLDCRFFFFEKPYPSKRKAEEDGLLNSGNKNEN